MDRINCIFATQLCVTYYLIYDYFCISLLSYNTN